jgi:hypothetical protein
MAAFQAPGKAVWLPAKPCGSPKARLPEGEAPRDQADTGRGRIPERYWWAGI